VPLKELKVNLPMDVYLQLVRLKILHGQPIGWTFEEALRRYFEAAPPVVLLDLSPLPEPKAASDGLA
jgi:hypothetical protein